MGSTVISQDHPKSWAWAPNPLQKAWFVARLHPLHNKHHLLRRASCSQVAQLMCRPASTTDHPIKTPNYRADWSQEGACWWPWGQKIARLPASPRPATTDCRLEKAPWGQMLETLDSSWTQLIASYPGLWRTFSQGTQPALGKTMLFGARELGFHFLGTWLPHLQRVRISNS